MYVLYLFLIVSVSSVLEAHYNFQKLSGRYSTNEQTSHLMVSVSGHCPLTSVTLKELIHCCSKNDVHIVSGFLPLRPKLFGRCWAGCTTSWGCWLRLDNDKVPHTPIKILMYLAPTYSVLCRSCDFFSTDAIISKLSPVSLYSFNDTIFNTDEILVQVLPKDFILQFPIITTESSACLGVGEWVEDDYWFPGYRWKPCGCSKCGTFIGLMFEPIDPFSVVIPEQFFSLIPAHLVSKNCKYTFWDFLC